jgi:hypothetical protein
LCTPRFFNGTKAPRKHIGSGHAAELRASFGKVQTREFQKRWERCNPLKAHEARRTLAARSE